jgi:hypothetical protein
LVNRTQPTQALIDTTGELQPWSSKFMIQTTLHPSQTVFSTFF